MHPINVSIESERPFVRLFGAIRKTYAEEERKERRKLAEEINDYFGQKPSIDEVVATLKNVAEKQDRHFRVEAVRDREIGETKGRFFV